MGNDVKNILEQKLKDYKQKYFTNILVKGAISFFSTLFAALLLVSFLGYYGHFDQIIRAILFFGFTAVELYFLVMWIAVPIYQLVNLDKHLSHELASKNIGNFFPSNIR